MREAALACYTPRGENGLSDWKGNEPLPRCAVCELVAPGMCFVRSVGPTCPNPSRCREIKAHRAQISEAWKALVSK